jgi:epoxyqueuosine reductase
MTPQERTRHVLDRCHSLGFALAGVADAGPPSTGDFLRAWLAGGSHGTMSYLAEQLAERLDPQLVQPGARSVLMVADLYHARGTPEPPAEQHPGHGRIARYARGRNYHDVIKRRLHRLADELRELFPGSEHRSFVDTAPVLEREFAQRCGLGWIGKNTMLIHPRLGSYLLLGGFFTTLDLSPPEEQPTFPDHCGTCTRCIDACPTRAITPYRVEASRCISYLTIEHKGDIAEDLMAGMGEWLAGCDICQEVCPHNSPRASVPDRVAEAYSPRYHGFPSTEVLGWSAEDRRQAFTTSALKRIPLAVLRRNAAIVLANYAVRATPRERQAAADRLAEASRCPSEDPIVRHAAAWGLRRLSASPPAADPPAPPPTPGRSATSDHPETRA